MPRPQARRRQNNNPRFPKRMTMILASGPFDNPWLVAVFIIVGMLSNWLMKRRQEKESRSRSEQAEPPPIAEKPKSEFDLEAALRRLLDEDPPGQQPAPPVIPRTGQIEPPPIPDYQAEGFDDAEQMERTERRESRGALAEAPTMRPATIVPGVNRVTTLTPEQNQAAARFRQLEERSRLRITAPDKHRRASAATQSMHWRNRHTARQAFVASLIFGPPKGLEP